MRRNSLALLAVFLCSSAVVPQAQVQVMAQGAPTVVPRPSLDDVVARLLSFDRNQNGQVETIELVERMQPLVAHGDANGDRALDRTEILRLATALPEATAARGFQTGRYGFADEGQVSFRSHIEGALEDLRLATSAKDKALHVVDAWVNAWEGSPRANLQLRGACAGGVGVVCNATALTLTSQAALTRFRARSQPDEAQRAELLDQLRGILDDEERDNFRAALERRPVVALGSVAGRLLAPAVNGGNGDHRFVLPSSAFAPGR
jgi:hypothetical protein